MYPSRLRREQELLASLPDLLAPQSRESSPGSGPRVELIRKTISERLQSNPRSVPGSLSLLSARLRRGPFEAGCANWGKGGDPVSPSSGLRRRKVTIPSDDEVDSSRGKRKEREGEAGPSKPPSSKKSRTSPLGFKVVKSSSQSGEKKAGPHGTATAQPVPRLPTPQSFTSPPVQAQPVKADSPSEKSKRQDERSREVGPQHADKPSSRARSSPARPSGANDIIPPSSQVADVTPSSQFEFGTPVLTSTPKLLGKERQLDDVTPKPSLPTPTTPVRPSSHLPTPSVSPTSHVDLIKNLPTLSDLLIESAKKKKALELEKARLRRQRAKPNGVPVTEEMGKPVSTRPKIKLKDHLPNFRSSSPLSSSSTSSSPSKTATPTPSLRHFPVPPPPAFLQSSGGGSAGASSELPLSGRLRFDSQYDVNAKVDDIAKFLDKDLDVGVWG